MDYYPSGDHKSEYAPWTRALTSASARKGLTNVKGSVEAAGPAPSAQLPAAHKGGLPPIPQHSRSKYNPPQALSLCFGNDSSPLS